MFGRGKAATLKAIDRLGYVQIDAISVIERAHHHTLRSRVSNYKRQFLDQLLTPDKKVFEYWSHAVAFLPMKDYRFYKWRMEHMRDQKKHWYPVDDASKQQILERLEGEGPLFARDFESKKRTAGDMWNYSPAKMVLHELFMEGKVMAVRHNFQRQYDLTNRVLPHDIDCGCPGESEVAKFFVKKFLLSHGIGAFREMVYQQPDLRSIIGIALPKMLASAEVLSVRCKGVEKLEYFMLPEALESMPSRVLKRVQFLSPFDNSVIQRKRLKTLFNFDYQTEIYLAKNKRIYGYFAMPLLYGTEFIGRIDPKADRESQTLIIHNLHIDEHVKITDYLLSALRTAIFDFAEFNDCKEISISKMNVPLKL